MEESKITIVPCKHEGKTMFVKSCCGEPPVSINWDAHESDYQYCYSCGDRFTLLECCVECGEEVEKC